MSKGELVNFKINFAQNKVLEAIEEQQKERKPVRIICLKARRLGISTLIESLLYHKVSMCPHYVGMVIAHELDSAKEIFEMTRRFYFNHRKPNTRPMLRGLGIRAMMFDNPNPNSPVRGLDSKLIVETAMDVQAGRSMEINGLHISEMAFYRDADTLTKGLLNCVNMTDPKTMVVMESTGNGIGGFFYDQVQRAIDGKSDYKMVFLPWFIFDDYKMDPPKDWIPKEREEKVRNKYQYESKRICLSDAQLYWRQKKIENDLKGDETKFYEEFPGSVEESFQHTGRTRFNQERLTEIESKAKPQIFRGFLHEEDSKIGWKHNLEENERGYLTIFEHPIAAERYVMFFDVAEGKEQPGREEESKTDFSAGDVLKCSTLEQVAHWHGKIGPEFLDDEFIKLGRYYNNAFGGIEKNSIGYGVVASVKDKYPNFYVREVHDKLGNLITKEYGWRTTGGKNSGTKGLMIKDLAEHIGEGLIQINHLGTIEECRRFSVHSDGSLAAPAGGFDDRVIALAGALQMYLHDHTEPKGELPANYDEEDEYLDDLKSAQEG